MTKCEVCGSYANSGAKLKLRPPHHEVDVCRGCYDRLRHKNRHFLDLPTERSDRDYYR